ncbi:hypothetical protein VA7868_00469 [Vibrio aerogenes CECT 7868]|uniref:Uncharacterized protein n=1 Tax=Vibrio aerogenes CECT 7868 TaxID=1216006 RepID=A0A1M5VNY7_9VIBR|nr:hypothetical protein VA7868_00469 [Vibrio aerogenes CECT 7868]
MLNTNPIKYLIIWVSLVQQTYKDMDALVEASSYKRKLDGLSGLRDPAHSDQKIMELDNSGSVDPE